MTSEQSPDVHKVSESSRVLQEQGRQHVLEAVRLAHNVDEDSYARLASFLIGSNLDFPIDIRPAQVAPGFWVERLWDRTGLYRSIPSIDQSADVNLSIQEADEEIAEAESLDPNSIRYSTSLTSAEIGLVRAVGKSADDGDFDIAEAAIDKIRVISDKLGGDSDSLVEVLAYLGVAKIKSSKA